MKKINPETQKELIRMMVVDNLSQRDIQRITGISRPYIRKLAKEINHQFPRNGIEVVGTLCMCCNCLSMFRRPPSKVEKAVKHFCSYGCRVAFSTGPNHPSWRKGESARTFSQWITNQASYKEFRETVLERDGHKCVITGSIEELDVHHVLPKAEGFHPEKAVDPSNGITVSKPVHDKIHNLIRDGVGFEEAVELVQKEYANTGKISL